MKDSEKKFYTEYFWDNILEWYKENKREFPWRNTENPFYILIAEFLLQQTNARKVENIYLKLISKYPKPVNLAEAEVEEVKNIIKPLGLIYRAERMIKSAEKISSKHEGNVPKKLDELKNIFGVGNYIAEAVRCYGFQEKTAPIDTNVIRLFTRFFGINSDKKRPRTDSKLKEKIKNLYRYNDSFSIKNKNLAVLDFAAEICSAYDPCCDLCTLSCKCSKYKK